MILSSQCRPPYTSGNEYERLTDDMIEPLVFPIIFFAIFIQSLIGFGSGLIAMPLLILLFGVNEAAALFSLVGLANGTVLLLYYRNDWSWQQIWRVWLASFIMIPFGVILADRLDEQLVMVALGVLTMGYALYALAGNQIPRVQHQRWAYGFGVAAGLLHGAYNTGGPPLVVYGNSQGWPPSQFKGNIQGLFYINGLLVIFSHWYTGHFTYSVLSHFLLLLPIAFFAAALGLYLERYVDPGMFQRAVLVLLVILGLTLIF